MSSCHIEAVIMPNSSCHLDILKLSACHITVTHNVIVLLTYFKLRKNEVEIEDEGKTTLVLRQKLLSFYRFIFDIQLAFFAFSHVV
jgi:hypothetical protein